MLGGSQRAHEEIEQELTQARAEALGRIGRRLEHFLTQVARLELRLTFATDAERPAVRRLYEEAHENAVLYRWYLEVQREAIGLRNHSRLDDDYRVPPRRFD